MSPTPPIPDNPEAWGWLGKMVFALGGIITGFIGAVWATAWRVSGYDARLKALEEAHSETAKGLYAKLDSLHKRIDDILLHGTTTGRHNEREGE